MLEKKWPRHYPAPGPLFFTPIRSGAWDLGIHQPRDPVIYLSNSGTTPELVYLNQYFVQEKRK